ncbi:hypothetical protein Tsubulata_023081 [Turnera subulata]|uniref:Protein argonaute N-terminal domain-containing protein n=1 Tax=Turnera subulata TaxID=218843 RepID=A0A9Q0JD80_9ROSI|nr:hypothetical protein Tsubulata_023081 [Turnera subulata]
MPTCKLKGSIGPKRPLDSCTKRTKMAASEELPPPPHVIPANVVPLQLAVPDTKKMSKSERRPMTRRGTGSRGQRIQLFSNHFKVGISNSTGHFFHYSVSLFYEDGRAVDAKGIGRTLLDKVHQTYDSALAGKDFAYDGEKNLFTVGPLPRNKMEFTVLLDKVSSTRSNAHATPDGVHERKRMKRAFHSKTFKVEISFAAKITMQAITAALQGQESKNSQEGLRVLDIILRQHAAKQ